MSQYQAIVDPLLPWDPSPGENTRMRFLLALMLLLALLIIIVVNVIKIPVIDRSKAEAIPENLATVVLEQKKEPPPPPPKPAEQPKQEKTEVKTEEVKPQPKEEVPDVEKVEPKAVQMDAKTAAARAKAAQALKDSGVEDALASLRESMPAGDGGLAGDLGNGQQLVTNTAEAGSTRNQLTSKGGAYSNALAGQGPVSGGFGKPGHGGKGTGTGGDGFALSGGGGMSAKVKDNIAKGDKLASAGEHAKSKDGKSVRSDEDIRRVFDANQGRLNNAYQRALRDNPNLQGEVVVQLSISPDGSVTSCSVASSALNDAELEAKLMTIIKGFHFEAGEFAAWSGKHSINFFPG